MSDDDPVPRLPPPPTLPRPAVAGSPPGADPLVDAFDVHRGLLESHRAERRAAAKRAARRRFAAVAIVVVCVVGAVVGAVKLFGGSDSPGVSEPPGPQFVIETAAFEFAFPAEPSVEPLATSVAGLEFTGSAWTLDADDQLLQVLGLDFGVPLDEDMAQASFDATNGGMARRGGGTIAADEIISADGVWGRRSVIALDGGSIFVTNYAKGNWIVSISVAVPGSRQPVEYDDLIASFRFR